MKRTYHDVAHGSTPSEQQVLSTRPSKATIPSFSDIRGYGDQPSYAPYDAQAVVVESSPDINASALQRTEPDRSSTFSRSPGIDAVANAELQSQSPDALVAKIGSPAPFKNRQEVEYFVHFKDKIAPWIDVCDQQQHFGVEVPRRAFSSPLLLQSIFASGCLQLSALRNVDDIASYAYYNQALGLLIPLLDRPESLPRDELLAAIVILRGYEEFMEGDQGTHLFGSARLLDHLTGPDSPGGPDSTSSLSTAARWVILRQYVYFGLTRCEPIRLGLQTYINLNSNTPFDDETWCNHAVLLFAQVLEHSFRAKGIPASEWEGLAESNELWFQNKPSSFTPIWEELPSDTSETSFPLTWCLQDVHLIGLQHYHLTKILLAIFDPRTTGLGFESFKRKMDANVSFPLSAVQYKD